jgi:hypothetical protein
MDDVGATDYAAKKQHAPVLLSPISANHTAMRPACLAPHADHRFLPCFNQFILGKRTDVNPYVTIQAKYADSVMLTAMACN